MISDEERRRVACRLREFEIGVIGTVIPTSELAKNILKAIGYGHSSAMTPYGLLADLIDPTCKAHRDTLFYPATLYPDRVLDDVEREETVFRCGKCGEIVSYDENYNTEADLPAYCEMCGSRITGIGETWDE